MLVRNLLITVLSSLLVGGNLFSREFTALEIIRKVDATERVASSVATIRQEIETSGGKKRTLVAKTYSKDKNRKQLMEYLEPARVKGDKILMLDDGNEIYFYTPRTRRVRHLASHARKQKVHGSDFSYEDLSHGDLEKDYTSKLLGEEEIDGRPCYKLELIPTESGPHYRKLILWADKERFITLQIDYFEEESEPTKRLHCREIQNIQGHWTPMVLIMENLAEGGRTVMITEEIKYDVDLPDEMFTTQNLKRRR
ncbi:MAG: outer membrane lipoprotein-sorting protein [Calditrichia bacterium]